MAGLFLMGTVFLVCFLVGYLLISRVPQLLHTPLMSLTNAISGVVILACLLLFAAEMTTAEKVLGAVAAAFALFNLVGGFVITDRMLRLFRKRPPTETVGLTGRGLVRPDTNEGTRPDRPEREKDTLALP